MAAGSACLPCAGDFIGVPRRFVTDLIAEAAAAHPASPAVLAGSDRLAYRELEQRANRLAHRLHRLGYARSIGSGSPYPPGRPP